MDSSHNWYTWGKCEIQERVKCNVLEKKLHWTKGGPVYHVSYLLQLNDFFFFEFYHSKQFKTTSLETMTTSRLIYTHVIGILDMLELEKYVRNIGMHLNGKSQILKLDCNCKYLKLLSLECYGSKKVM